jgi:hypothetical protein
MAASSITTPGAITSTLPGEALLPPAGAAAPQAVVARDRLAQRLTPVSVFAIACSAAWRILSSDLFRLDGQLAVGRKNPIGRFRLMKSGDKLSPRPL